MMRSLAIMALLAATACTSGASQSTGLSQAVGLVREQATNLVRGTEPARVTLSDQQLREFEQDLLIIEIPSENASAGLVRQIVNRDTETWLTPDGIGVTLRNGQLVGTAGLGGDLSSGRMGDIRAGSGETIRDYYYLAGTEQIERRRFFCALSTAGREEIDVAGRIYDTTRIVEACESGAGESFQNTYWVQGDGRIRKSLQYVSPEVGSLVIEDIHGGWRAA